MPPSSRFWTLRTACKLQAPLYRTAIPSQLRPRRPNSTTSDTPHTSRSSAPRFEAESPVDDYYAQLLSQPLPVAATTSSPSSGSPPSPSPTPRPAPSDASAAPGGPQVRPESVPDDPVSRARIVFGSRLAGPAARAAREESRGAMKARGEGEWIAGTWIPPRPAEPDNCCMSGCVNCVWDGYREELEDWAGTRKEARSREARVRVREREERIGASAASMDDDGGGSEALWREGDAGLSGAREWGEGGLFEGVPVGIREFMRTEKRLGEMKRRRAEAQVP